MSERREGNDPEGARTRVGLWARHGRSLAIATLAVAAAVPTQAVFSQEPASSPDVDPDCVKDGETAGSAAAAEPQAQAAETTTVNTVPDGICPPDAAGQGEPAPPPPPPDDQDKPSRPQGDAGEQPGPQQDADGSPASRAPAGPGDVNDDPARRDRTRSGHARRPRHRAHGRRRHTRRQRRARSHHRPHARRHRHNRSAHRLSPVPHWAKSLLATPLPDPLPAGKRLSPRFAELVERTSEREHVSWSLLLAILRARGHEGATPASGSAVSDLAKRLASLDADNHQRRALAMLSGEWPGERHQLLGDALLPHITFADRVLALAGFNRAVGLDGLVQGLDAVKEQMQRRILRSDRLLIYPGGRSDIANGRIDVRVLAVLLYLAHRHGSVTVSCLKTGHSFFTKSGNVSAHSYGRAVDIGAIGGISILGHQDPGGITERALREILLLPEELQPKQLITLFELGGPSFAMADHADHIHVGY
jgi:hypothetical protein